MHPYIKTFSERGGTLLCEATELEKRLRNIKAYIYDWDGVFNNGQKFSAGGSPFSEVDSMGTNLLRFSHYLRTGTMPISAVISGEKNESAIFFSEREGFHYSFFKTPHKIEALQLICERQKLRSEEIAYVFDDVLDLSIAEACGLRVLVRHRAKPMFEDYCTKHKLADYITANDGGNHAVRESCELMMALQGNYEACIRHRSSYSETYAAYLNLRRVIKPEVLSIKDGKIQDLSLF